VASPVEGAFAREMGAPARDVRNCALVAGVLALVVCMAALNVRTHALDA
jgi:hypothetical protein